MDNKNNRIAPEISSANRKNRKKRKLRGGNVSGWEKLKERPIDAPVSVDGVGLVSTHYSYAGSAGGASGKELNTEEVIPKRVKKKKGRRAVFSGERLDVDILNPPPTPAGRTVTAFGGGIIPPITNGGINRDAITGKALPRIGRRILNNAKITGDQNRLTRVDGNNNGLIFDGTALEMPDPTPGGSITGEMGMIDRFKKPKPKQYVPKRNDTPFIGNDRLISEQANQVRKFKTWADSGNWAEFHKQHFDWWTFPINRGSSGYGFQYDISGQPLEDLKKNPEYLQSLKTAAELYLKSMAWDLKKHDWITNPDFNAGQDPVNNINQARLFKIGRSLQIHRLDDEFQSTKEMVHSLRSAGYRVGNELFWDNPDTYHRVSSYRNPGNGITGAMAGISAIPFPKAIDGGRQRDMRGEDSYKKLWKDRDDAAIEYAKSGKIPKDVEITFAPGDEKSRLQYINDWRLGLLKNFHAKLPTSTEMKTTEGVNPQITKRMNKLNQLGVFHGGFSAGHGRYYNQYSLQATHSGTAGDPYEFPNQIRNLRGLFWHGNTSQKHASFDSWRRNPFVTMRDEDGKDVGVEHYFRKHFPPEMIEQEMMNEFEKRIMDFFNPLDKEEGQKAKHNMSHALQPLDDNTKLGDYSFIREHILKKLDDAITSFSDAKTDSNIRALIERLREVNDVNDGPGNTNKIDSPVIQEILEKRHPDLKKKLLEQNPGFFDETDFDHISWTDEQTARGYLRIQYEDDLNKGFDPAQLDVADWARVSGLDFVDPETFQKLHNEEIKKLSEGQTGK